MQYIYILNLYRAGAAVAHEHDLSSPPPSSPIDSSPCSLTAQPPARSQLTAQPPLSHTHSLRPSLQPPSPPGKILTGQQLEGGRPPLSHTHSPAATLSTAHHPPPPPGKILKGQPAASAHLWLNIADHIMVGIGRSLHGWNQPTIPWLCVCVCVNVPFQQPTTPLPPGKILKGPPAARGGPGLVWNREPRLCAARIARVCTLRVACTFACCVQMLRAYMHSARKQGRGARVS